MNRRRFLAALPALWVALQTAGAGTEELAVAHLRIEGMTGGGGAFLAKRALEGLKGVRSADVSFYRSEATVRYERGAVTIEQMNQAVSRYGFTATLKNPDGR